MINSLSLWLRADPERIPVVVAIGAVCIILFVCKCMEKRAQKKAWRNAFLWSCHSAQRAAYIKSEEKCRESARLTPESFLFLVYLAGSASFAVWLFLKLWLSLGWPIIAAFFTVDIALLLALVLYSWAYRALSKKDLCSG